MVDRESWKNGVEREESEKREKVEESKRRLDGRGVE